MNIGNWFKTMGIVAIFILAFILAFYPPIVWQGWIEYIMTTPIWTTIGQMGFLFLAIIAGTVGVVFVKELVFG